MHGTLPRSGARAGLALSLTVVLLSLSCAGRSGQISGSHIPRDERFGVYRATAVDSTGEPRRFRLWLFAAPPDRIHAEVVHPVTGPRLVVDGGGDRLAVTVVDEKIAYVGQTETGPSLESLGIAVSLEDLVAMVLEGRAPDGEGPWFRREPPTGEGLPRTFEIEASEGTLHLELQKYRALKGGGSGSIGTGQPASGVEVRPLDELGEREDAGLLLGGDASN
jgi:hypothetical protein